MLVYDAPVERVLGRTGAVSVRRVSVARVGTG